MAFSVVTNNNAMAALQALNNTSRAMTATQNRITTGMKVAGAADNASTFAIAQGMRGDISGLKAASQSISLGKSTVGVALSAAQQISDKLNELKGKVTEGQGQNVDLAKIQQDMDSIVTSITNIGAAAQFNGVNLLNNSSPNGLTVLTGLNRTSATAETISNTTVAAQNLTTATLGISGLTVTGNTSIKFSQTAGLAFASGDVVSITANNAAGAAITYKFEIVDGTAGDTLASTTTTTPTGAAGSIAIAVVSDPATDTPSQTLGKLFTAMRGAGFSVTNNEDGSFAVASSGTITGAATVTGTAAADLSSAAPAAAASGAFTSVETAINTVKAAVAALGTSSNSLDASAKFVSSLTDALTEGVGSLVDADMAEESANLQALQTRQQLGIQALSIANQGPSSIMALFRG